MFDDQATPTTEPTGPTAGGTRPRGALLADGATWALAMVVALVPLWRAIVLWQGGWVPVGDNANIAIRGVDVGGRATPLIGMPSGLVNYATTDATHPGPLVFWVIGPWVRLFGARPLPVLLGTVAVTAASVLAAAWVAWRHARRQGVVAVALAFALCWALVGYNLVQPLNPSLAFAPTVAALVAAWAIAGGTRGAAVPVFVVTASFSAQAESAYVPTMGLVAGAVAVQALVERRRSPSGAVVSDGVEVPVGPMGDGDREPPVPEPQARRALRVRPSRVTVVAAVAFLACWSGPLADVALHGGGNVRETLRVAGSADVDPQGWPAARSALVALVSGFRWALDVTSSSEPSLSPVAALVVLAAAVLLGRAGWRARPRATRGLALVVAVTVAATALGQTYTPGAAGRQSPYLLPVAAAGALCWFGLAWLAGEALSRRPRLAGAVGGVVGAMVLLLAIGYPTKDVFLEPGSDAVEELAAEVRAEVPAGRYLLVPGGGPNSQGVLRGVGFLLEGSGVDPVYPADQGHYVGGGRIDGSGTLPQLVITRGDLATRVPSTWVRVAAWSPPGRDDAELEAARRAVVAQVRAAGPRFTHQAAEFQIGLVLAACGEADATVLTDSGALIDLGRDLSEHPEGLADVSDLVLASLVEEQVVAADDVDRRVLDAFRNLTNEDAVEIWLAPPAGPGTDG